MMIAIAAGLLKLGRSLSFDYTLHGGGHTIRRSFGPGESSWSEPLVAA